MNFQLKRLFYFSFIIASLACSQVIAQDVKPEARRPHEAPLSINAIDLMPEFPGGKDALADYLANNLNYTDSAKNAHINGRVVTRFVIQGDGNISDIAIVETPGYGLSEEVVRVLKGMPRWKPGKKDGEAVSVYFVLPVFFNLPPDSK